MELTASGGVQGRSLSGAKARRIVEATRESVAEVGIAGSTFGRIAAKAGVSRGLLHYYFGTKERLLVEVIRRDTEIRVSQLSEAMSAADTVDELIATLFDTFQRTISTEHGYVYMVSELFVAGRTSEDLSRELGELYSCARRELAEILRRKESEGVIKLRFDAEAVLFYLFAAGDGSVVQWITDPTLDPITNAETSYAVARYLLSADR